MCNHVTEFDHNVINLLTPCNTVSTYVLYVRHLKHVFKNYYVTVNKVLIVYNQNLNTSLKVLILVCSLS